MIRVGISSSLYSPIHCIFAIVKSVDNLYVIPNKTIIHTEWGKPINDDSFVTVKDDCFEIDILWISIFENQIYRYNCNIKREELKDISNILIGCSLFGNVCIWNYDQTLSQVYLFDKGCCINNGFSKHFNKDNYSIELINNLSFTINELCYLYQKGLYDEYGIDNFDSINVDDLMNQYSYRYCPILEFNNITDEEPLKFKHIEELLNNGTFNKRNDEKLLKEHLGAIPQKLLLKWDIGMNEYVVFVCFDYCLTSIFFEKFYGSHKNTKTDFVVRINPNDEVYVLSLFRQGLSEPQEIPKDAYQLIVFKNNFELFRSDNYNQEHGAWIW